MRVSRSELSLPVSIHRERCVSGANAMSPSLAGSGPGRSLLRMNLSALGPAVCPESTGFHRVAGASPGSSVTLRGPVRRSSDDAIEVRQLAAAIVRSASVIDTCASFSASANVVGETSGPTGGAVPNVGGAPGGGAFTGLGS